jgi:hypothetical protein
MNLILHFSDWYLEWLLAIAFVGGIAAPLNYRWVSKFDINMMPNFVVLFLTMHVWFDSEFVRITVSLSP